jgi:hypothetical protein
LIIINYNFKDQEKCLVREEWEGASSAVLADKRVEGGRIEAERIFISSKKQSLLYLF